MNDTKGTITLAHGESNNELEFPINVTVFEMKLDRDGGDKGTISYRVDPNARSRVLVTSNIQSDKATLSYEAR